MGVSLQYQAKLASGVRIVFGNNEPFLPEHR